MSLLTSMLGAINIDVRKSTEISDTGTFLALRFTICSLERLDRKKGRAAAPETLSCFPHESQSILCSGRGSAVLSFRVLACHVHAGQWMEERQPTFSLSNEKCSYGGRPRTGESRSTH